MSNARKSGARKGWETRRQNEERAAVNLPVEMLLVWESEKAAWGKLDPHARAEACVEWAEEHEGEVAAILEAHAESETDRLIAEFERRSA